MFPLKSSSENFKAPMLLKSKQRGSLKSMNEKKLKSLNFCCIHEWPSRPAAPQKLSSVVAISIGIEDSRAKLYILLVISVELSTHKK